MLVKSTIRLYRFTDYIELVLYIDFVRLVLKIRAEVYSQWYFSFVVLVVNHFVSSFKMLNNNIKYY